MVRRVGVVGMSMRVIVDGVGFVGVGEMGMEVIKGVFFGNPGGGFLKRGYAVRA